MWWLRNLRGSSCPRHKIREPDLQDCLMLHILIKKYTLASDASRRSTLKNLFQGLLQCGLNPSQLCPADGQRPLQVALDNDCSDLAFILQKYMADPKDGMTGINSTANYVILKGWRMSTELLQYTMTKAVRPNEWVEYTTVRTRAIEISREDRNRRKAFCETACSLVNEGASANQKTLPAYSSESG